MCRTSRTCLTLWLQMSSFSNVASLCHNFTFSLWASTSASGGAQVAAQASAKRSLQGVVLYCVVLRDAVGLKGRAPTHFKAPLACRRNRNSSTYEPCPHHIPPCCKATKADQHCLRNTESHTSWPESNKTSGNKEMGGAVSRTSTSAHLLSTFQKHRACFKSIGLVYGH